MLFFRFRDGASVNRRRGAFLKAVDKLLTLEDGFTGEALQGDPQLARVLESVCVARGRFTGPIFDSPTGGFVGDPTTRLIQQKFSKTYLTDHPRQLLAYIDLNPMLPEAVWRGNLVEFLDDQPKPLPFEKVWIFEVRKARVLLEYSGS